MYMFRDAHPSWSAWRLSHLYEVGRRIRRLGIWDVEVNCSEIQVEFHDHRVHADVALMIEPLDDGSTGWFWYADIELPDGFDMGPLGLGRRILVNPYPREVVRAYQRRLCWEMRPPRRKVKGR